MGTFGDTLRQAREDLGASLEDAERETRINRRYLEALEAENQAALPAPVYTRGFIRTYCQYLGLSAEALLDLFGPKEALEDRPQIRPIPTQEEPRRSISLKPVVALGLVVLLGLLFAYLWTQYNAFVESLSQIEQLPTSRQATATVVPKPIGVAPGVGASPAAKVGTSPTPARGLVIEARFNERTWIEVWADDQAVLSETVNGGGSRTFSANERIRMRVGNAAGVEVVVNGVSQGPLGARGQAVEATWGR